MIKQKTNASHSSISQKRIQLIPIGIIHSPFTQKIGTPIQSAFSNDGKGTIKVFPQFTQGLKDLKGFSHIILIYHFHKSKGYRLLCRPFLDEVERGLFATRAPRRPNPIGLSIVKLNKIKDNTISVSSLDVLDGTPLLDIKPYIPQFDAPNTLKIGWFAKAFRKKKRTLTADDRFTDEEREE